MHINPVSHLKLKQYLSDGHVEVASSKSDSYDTWIVRNLKGEVYTIQNDEFKRTYIEVLKKSDSYRIKSLDEHWVADGQPKRILALDGGGVRGILTLGYLKRIEEILSERHHNPKDFRLSHYFDLIAGTSTGAIIAACLAKGMKVSEVRALYGKFADSVFKRSWIRHGFIRAKFSAKKLKGLLKRCIPK